MNILVLNYEFPPIGGGGSAVCYEVSKRLAQRGHSIDVVTMYFTDLPKEEVVDGLRVHRVKCLRSDAHVCRPWEQFTYIISAIRYIKKSINIDSVDVIHTHFIIPTGPIAWYLKRKYGKEYTLIAHGSDVPGHNNGRFGLLYKLLMRPWKKMVEDAEHVVSLSEYLKDLICKNMGEDYNPDNITVIRNGIDTKLYKSLEKKKIILFMGRLQEGKGIQDVLKLFTHEFLGDWKVIIAGDGPYRSELIKIVKEQDITENVELCGWIESKSPEHLKLLGESYIYISPSHFENSPITPLEAYCSGCKVILSDIKAHRECLGDEALYYNIDRPVEVMDMICSTMNGYTKYANERKIKQFDWEIRIDNYEEL